VRIFERQIGEETPHFKYNPLKCFIYMLLLEKSAKNSSQPTKDNLCSLPQNVCFSKIPDTPTVAVDCQERWCLDEYEGMFGFVIFRILTAERSQEC
jgi:hypothetical protein